MKLTKAQRNELCNAFIEVASSFDEKTVREHNDIEWLDEKWDEIEDEYYEIAEEVCKLILCIKQPEQLEKSLYDQLNDKAREYMMDIENPVILYAYGRYNRGCYEISGEDVCPYYGKEGDYAVPDSEDGAEEWWGLRNMDDKFIPGPGEEFDVTECLKKKSDVVKLLEEVSESPDDWESVVLIYWDPESKSINFQLTDPSQ